MPKIDFVVSPNGLYQLQHNGLGRFHLSTIHGPLNLDTPALTFQRCDVLVRHQISRVSSVQLPDSTLQEMRTPRAKRRKARIQRIKAHIKSSMTHVKHRLCGRGLLLCKNPEHWVWNEYDETHPEGRKWFVAYPSRPRESTVSFYAQYRTRVLHRRYWTMLCYLTMFWPTKL